jgi:hypothetical protein
MNGPVLAAAFAVGVVIAIGLFVVVATYNDVVALQRRIEKAWANIEVALQQRFDQLPALVDAVRGLMTFERDVLTEVTAARAAYSPRAPDPRPGGDLGRDEPGAPVALRGRRAVSGGEVRRQRPRPAERDRTARIDDRRPA